jgi:flagella basal body P-ring formation protein FlgA
MVKNFQRAIILIISLAALLLANEQERMSYYAEMGKNVLMEKFSVTSEDLEVELVYLPRLESTLSSDLVFHPVINSPKLRPGRMMMWISAYKDGEIERRFSVPLNVKVYQDVLVAAKDIDRNEELAPENIQLVRIALDREPGYYMYDYSELDGKIASQRIRQGYTLRKTMTREKPDIFKGDPVKIQIQGKNFRIQADGVAWEDGQVGEQIRVSNRITGKMMQAQIHSVDLVIVE